MNNKAIKKGFRAEATIDEMVNAKVFLSIHQDRIEPSVMNGEALSEKEKQLCRIKGQIRFLNTRIAKAQGVTHA